MTDLEVVALFAWGFMTYIVFSQRRAIRELRNIIIDIGLKEARVEIDQERHIVHIIRK